MNDSDLYISLRSEARQIELPEIMRVVRSTGKLGDELASVLAELEATNPIFVSGTATSKELTGQLAHGAATTAAADNSRAEVARIAAMVINHDLVVAVGGGRPIDVAKAAGRDAEIPVLTVPTQLSTDSIASPVAVIAEADGTVVSEGAQLPVAVVADLGLLASAPIAATRAGFGDLIANRTALIDWQLSAVKTGEPVDDFAALLAAAAHRLVEGLDLDGLAAGKPSEEITERLLEGLVMSGLAMGIAGSSRPCSGSEHLISHALDQLEPGLATHGEQVAFGTLVATQLQSGDVDFTRGLLARAGLTDALDGFGLPFARLAEAVHAAPATRAGRYTVLDDAALSKSGAEAVLAGLIER